jgi:hypothetical protein
MEAGIQHTQTCRRSDHFTPYERQTMRLSLIAPADLTPEQRPLYDDMRKGIASNFNTFKVEREDGALMGP